MYQLWKKHIHDTTRDPDVDIYFGDRVLRMYQYLVRLGSRRENVGLNWDYSLFFFLVCHPILLR